MSYTYKTETIELNIVNKDNNNCIKINLKINNDICKFYGSGHISFDSLFSKQRFDKYLEWLEEDNEFKLHLINKSYEKKTTIITIKKNSFSLDDFKFKNLDKNEIKKIIETFRKHSVEFKYNPDNLKYPLLIRNQFSEVFFIRNVEELKDFNSTSYTFENNEGLLGLYLFKNGYTSC